jgi:hypothetical protein
VHPNAAGRSSRRALIALVGLVCAFFLPLLGEPDARRRAAACERRGSNGAALATVRINGFYQGVVLPPFTGTVELAFEPLARWSFVPQWLFVGGLLWCALRAVLAQRPAGSTATR